MSSSKSGSIFFGLMQGQGIFETSIFSKRVERGRTVFIRAMHPKSEIRFDRVSVQKTLDAGWVGQLKIHGHRAQIHIPADPSESLVAYTRKGSLHQKALPQKMIQEIRRVFAPRAGWNVIDSEWLKPEDKIFVFDFLKRENQLLSDQNFVHRFGLIPRDYLSPHLQTLPLLETADACFGAVDKGGSSVEGLVFKSRTSTGFEDTSIIRCRKKS